jgi:Uma2 family endonuclease
MALQQDHHRISAEVYLRQEISSDIKHQLIDGEIFAMGGASENHNLLAGNIFSEFKSRLKGRPCRSFMADMKLGRRGFFLCGTNSDAHPPGLNAPSITWGICHTLGELYNIV